MYLVRKIRDNLRQQEVWFDTGDQILKLFGIKQADGKITF